jgi:tetratricopeptide (TPR) repeat protein
MKLGTLGVAVVVGIALCASGCSRRAIEAVNLANEADQQKKVDVEGAITKYEQAVQLDPTNHRIMYKLAMAYKKKEVWEKVASTLARATQVAPTFANYWYERGYALVQVAEKASSHGAWEEAKEPLLRCTQADPKFAPCYHELGTVMLFLDSEEEALRNYSLAIERRPSEGYFYPPLADLYMRLDYFNQAEAALKAGLDVVRDDDKPKFYMYEMLAAVYQSKNNIEGMVSAFESANKLGGAEHPEILFNLGSTYAVQNPPKKTQAIQMLKQFFARACKGGKSDKYKEQCEQTNALIAKLGGVI